MSYKTMDDDEPTPERRKEIEKENAEFRKRDAQEQAEYRADAAKKAQAVQPAKPALPTCQTCGLDPVPTGIIGHVHCRFCMDDGCREDEWISRQFRARHEAIDKLIIAQVSDPSREGEIAFYQTCAVNFHDANLARRKAEAEKLIGGAK